MEKKRGIIGFTGSFRESVKDIKNNSKVVFVGSVAVCTPFIELLSYAVRDKNFDLIYVPTADIKSAKQVKMQKGIGFGVLNKKGNPKNPDVVVILGGLAMPKFGCPPEEVLDMVQEISGEQKPKIIGVCFMNIFERAEWDKKIPFNTLIDTTLETMVK